MKKVLSLILSVALMVSCLCTGTAFAVRAEAAPTIAVDTVTANAGDTVTAAVRVVNNPGIVGLRVRVDYDPAVLTPVTAEGGGLDACFIGALQVDRFGNANGHYAPGKLSGIGRFANISQATKKVVCCLTFTAKGLEGDFDGERVTIRREGAIPKFVPAVDGLSFSVKNAYRNNQEVLYITERCVFRLTRDGIALTEIAPGIDLQRDILDRLAFPVIVADDLKTMEF